MAKGGGIVNTALRMERIHLIHDRLKRGGRVHAKELCELCESYGLKASPRTIMRDIESLRSAFDAPIPDPPLPDGYYYTKKFDLVGEVMLEEGEILAFMVAQRVVEGLGGSPFAEALRNGLDRISKRLARKLPVRVEDLFQVDAGPLREVSPEVFLAVDRALSHRWPLLLSYRALSSDEGVTERVVEPYVLKNHRGDWYLIGYCRLRQAVRTFALSRMLRCSVVEGETFKVPADFDVEAYFANALSLFTGAKAERCTIWFSPLARRWITERRWHPSQEVEELPDGSIRLHLQVAVTQEVVRWILGHGEDAQALAPASLVAEVERHVRGMCRRLEPEAP